METHLSLSTEIGFMYKSAQHCKKSIVNNVCTFVETSTDFFFIGTYR